MRGKMWYNHYNSVRSSLRKPAYRHGGGREADMRLDPEVKSEVAKMARDCLILSLVMALGFLIAGKLNAAALYGLLIGYALAVGNFFFLSVGVTRALDTGDETAAKRVMLASRSARTVVLLAVMGVSIWLWTRSEAIHWLPVVAAAFYPRIVIAARGMLAWIRHRKDPAPVSSDSGADREDRDREEEDEEESDDEFEKFVGHFSKGPVPGEEQKKNQNQKKTDGSGDPDDKQ